MRIYLCSRFRRAAEMEQHAAALRATGHEVTSRWHTGIHKNDSRHAAEMDVEDVRKADTLIQFTEPVGLGARVVQEVLEMTDGSPAANIDGLARGGRHVEFGYALASGMRVVLVGPRENVFHHLPQVEQFDTSEECIRQLATWEENRTKGK